MGRGGCVRPQAQLGRNELRTGFSPMSSLPSVLKRNKEVKFAE